ncbi:MAG TPA: SpoIIE family protein phosphatase [Spirochaetota bacterium]|nr:SpoIIE family protein phosphatase [Spirochaetota bacterium]HPS85231.1 SpoIIE family protein phosphatase [Spirochaetota bacterium]
MKIINKILMYIKLEDERTSFPATFKQELDYQSSKILTFASLITLSWLTYIPIDLRLHPDKPLIIVLRIGFPVIGLLLFFSRFINSLRPRYLLMLTLFGAYMEISTAVLTAVTIGDPAYIGGYLFVLTLLAVAPLQRSDAYAILGVSLATFFSISWFAGMNFTNPHTMYSLNDIFCVTFIVSCFIFILNNSRYVRWLKSKEAEAGQVIIEDQKNQLEQQIIFAGDLHKTLLPQDIPVIEEAVISYKYAPMMELGGDFIDFCYNEKEKSLGLFVCDVSGHGVAGALFSSMVKISLNRWIETLANPSATLHNIYHTLKGKMGNHFVTAGVCHIDLITGSITYSSAGHLPLIIARKNGEIEFLNSRGRLIAEIIPPNYEETVSSIHEGDSVILYTDGVTECYSKNNKMFGEESFFNLIKMNCCEEPYEMNNNIFNELIKFNKGNNFSDDVTILILKYKGYNRKNSADAIG